MTIPVFIAAETPESGRSVVSAIESLMDYRLRADGFTAGTGGRRRDHFDNTTTPRQSHVEEVAQRKADEVERDYPRAVRLILEGNAVGDLTVNPTGDLVTAAAYRAAIELEASVPAPDYERIRVWRDSSRTLEASLMDRFGSKDDGGGPGLEAVWSFGDCNDTRTEGSEGGWPSSGGWWGPLPEVFPAPDSPRRLRW